MSLGREILGAGLAAGVVYGGAALMLEAAGLGDCFPNLKNCLPEGHQDGSGAKFGDMVIQSEDLTGTASVITFGEVTMKIGGEKSVFDYDDSAIIDTSDVDATIYWNGNGDRAQSVVYYPCIKLKDDYSQAFADHPQTINGATGELQRPKSGLSYAVDIYESGELKGQPRAVNVEAGFMDTCFMHVPNTPDNKLMWTDDHDNQTGFGATEEATFRWMVDELIMKYAASQSCPEAVIELDPVKDQIKQVVLGALVEKYPEYATALASGNVAWNINIEGPEARRQYYQQLFDQTKIQITNMNTSFPNPERGGKTYPLKKPQLGSFAVRECSVTQPVQLQLETPAA